MALGEAKGDWEALSLLSEKLGKPFMYRKSKDVFNEIAKTIAGFADMTYETIGDQGILLKK